MSSSQNKTHKMLCNWFKTKTKITTKLVVEGIPTKDVRENIRTKFFCGLAYTIKSCLYTTVMCLAILLL